jgi:flagellar basal body-associated protein FliL
MEYNLTSGGGKSGGNKKRSLSRIVFNVLLALFFILALIFLAGTVYGLLLRRNSSPAKIPAGENASPGNSGENIFTGIGRIRTFSAGEDPLTIVFSITFPYDPEDLAFSEELASRARDFRQIAGDYFGSFSPEEIKNRNEEAVKRELLNRYNAILRLGTIKNLFFKDFMIIE